VDHVADPMHVEDHEILAIGIHHAFEFADHVSPCSCFPPPCGEGLRVGVEKSERCASQ
jgi:hypothetical protein